MERRRRRRRRSRRGRGRGEEKEEDEEEREENEEEGERSRRRTTTTRRKRRRRRTRRRKSVSRVSVWSEDFKVNLVLRERPTEIQEVSANKKVYRLKITHSKLDLNQDSDLKTLILLCKQEFFKGYFTSNLCLWYITRYDTTCHGTPFLFCTYVRQC